MSTDKVAAFVQSDPELQGGSPVFRGTRVPLHSLFEHLEGGDSVEDFLAGFQTVKREQVMGVLAALREEGISQFTPDEMRQVRDWIEELKEHRLETTPEFKAKIERSVREMTDGKRPRVRS